MLYATSNVLACLVLCFYGPQEQIVCIITCRFCWGQTHFGCLGYTFDTMKPSREKQTPAPLYGDERVCHVGGCSLRKPANASTSQPQEERRKACQEPRMALGDFGQQGL